jgi:outer membrane protein assembly factor BamB
MRIVLFLVVLASSGLCFSEVVGFRDNGTSIYPNAQTPQAWSSTQNVLWSVPTKAWSNATPLVMDDRIILCEERDTVLCVSSVDGKTLWTATAGPAEAPGTPAAAPKAHQVNGLTSPTPVSDGKYVWTMNGYGIAACFDLAGTRRWTKFIATPKNGWGTSASPVLAGDIVAIQVADVLYALDASNGETRWKIPSPSVWGSPVVTRIGDKTVIIMPTGQFINAADGSVLAAKVSELNYNTPLLVDGIVYFMCGEKGCKAIRLPKTIDAKWQPEVLWTSKITKDERTYSSPVLANGVLYLITRYNQLAAFDSASGTLLYEKQLEFPKKSEAYPSIVVAGQYVLVSSDAGETIVIKPGREYQEVGRNTLSTFRSTPVIRGNRMYVRTLKGLTCVAAGQ